MVTAHTTVGDNMLDSVWTQGIRLPEFPRLEHDLKTDVLIVGGGMAGLLCGHLLRQAGVDCVLVEGDTVCSGITRNTTAKITSQHGLCYHKLMERFSPEMSRRYWEANEAALGRYRELARVIDCDFEEKDNYIYSTDSLEVLERELEALSKLWIPADFVNRLPLPLPVAGAIRFREQAQFHPLKFAAGIAKDQKIFENTRVREFVGNTVVTDRGKITASKIIVATHFPIINKHGAYFLKMYQQRSYVLGLENTPKLDGMYLDSGENGLSFRSYGDLLLLGGGGHRTGKPGDGWSGLEAFGSKQYPGSRVVYRWAAQDCMSLDGIPYIGLYSKRTPNLYVATGFNKWGMTSSMISAMILSDLVQGRENPFADVFSPQRPMAYPQLLSNVKESAGGLLKFTKPRCPHLGCALEWNSMEHSWDCPCHGSRFSEDGTLMDNPATKDMKNSRP